MTEAKKQPGKREFELTLIGPGYGESIILHVGNNVWVVVDSCSDPTEKVGALHYLKSIGVNPKHKIALIVATHWHDDHIRGMADLVELCHHAEFCCSNSLCCEEFLTLLGTFEGREVSPTKHGLKQLHSVFSQLEQLGKKPIFASANRVIFERDACTIKSLSPGDDTYLSFLNSIRRLIPQHGENKTQIPSLSPNKTSVVLWIECGECTVLLGADLERQGWTTILTNSVRPKGAASVFKIPHHGSKNADEPEVWNRMLEKKPFAVVAPWQQGGWSRFRPTICDVKRILEFTPNAWITTSKGTYHQSKPKHKNATVQRTLRESGTKIQPLVGDRGMVRLRRSIDSIDTWKVEKFGEACHLSDYVV